METIFAEVVSLVFSWQGLLIIALVIMTWKSEETMRFFGRLRALMWGVSNPTPRSPVEAGFAMTQAADRFYEIVRRGEEVLANLVIILMAKRQQQEQEMARLQERAEVLGELAPVSDKITLKYAESTLIVLQSKEREAGELLSAYRVATQAQEQSVVLVEVLGRALVTMGDIDVPAALQMNVRDLRRALSAGSIYSPVGWPVKSPELDGYLKVVQQQGRLEGSREKENGGEG